MSFPYKKHGFERFLWGIGIDVGGTKIWCVLGDSKGKILAEHRLGTPVEREAFLRQINSLVHMLLGEAGISEKDVAGIGIGFPGRVAGKKGESRAV